MIELSDNTSIIELKEAFSKASGRLFALDGIDATEEQQHISLVSDAITIAAETPSEYALTTAQNSLNLFIKYVHNKALLGTDNLTNLPNRAAFNEQLRTAIRENGNSNNDSKVASAASNIEENKAIHNANDTKNYFALIMVDLDRFKGINDDFGHQAGDTGLKAFADKLNSIVREDSNNFFSGRGRVARLGGDEFAIILHTTETSLENAKNIFNKAYERIREDQKGNYFTHEEKNIPLVSSMGMHVIEDEDTPATALKNADNALYADKQPQTKNARYEEAVKVLNDMGIENLQIIEDKRADPSELTKEQILKVIGHLREARAIDVLASDNALNAEIERAIEGKNPQLDL